MSKKRPGANAQPPKLDHVNDPERPHLVFYYHQQHGGIWHSCHETVREAGCIAAGKHHQAFVVSQGEEQPEDSELIKVGELHSLLADKPTLKCAAAYLPGYGKILPGHLCRVRHETEVAAVIVEKDQQLPPLSRCDIDPLHEILQEIAAATGAKKVCTEITEHCEGLRIVIEKGINGGTRAFTRSFFFINEQENRTVGQLAREFNAHYEAAKEAKR